MRHIDCGSSSSLEKETLNVIRSVKQVNETPFLVQVHSRIDGSLFDGYQLTNRWILTTASNIVHSNSDYYYLLVNSEITDGIKDTNKNVSIRRIIRHPLSGNADWLNNNLALIRMSESVNIESSICFPESEENVDSLLDVGTKRSSEGQNFSDIDTFFYGIGRPWSWSPRHEKTLKIFPVNLINYNQTIIQVRVSFCEHLRSSDPLIVITNGRHILLGFFKSIQGTCSVDEESMAINYMRITSDHSNWIYDAMFEKRKIFPVRKKLSVARNEVSASTSTHLIACLSLIFLLRQTFRVCHY